MDMTDKLLTNGKYDLEDLFLGGYNLTVEEAADLLDMSQRYIYDRLKMYFDYISVSPGKTHELFKEGAQELIKYNRKTLSKIYPNKSAGELLDQFADLSRKRMFINKKSFRRFLLNDLKIVTENPTTGEIIYKPIQTWQVDHILKGKAKLRSINTLKKNWGKRHNMQVYRVLWGSDAVRIALISNSDANPMIRYLFSNKNGDCNNS